MSTRARHASGRVLLALVCVWPSAVLRTTLARSQTSTAGGQAPIVTFTDDIGPLLSANCRPCHFKGGKVFDRLPFDQYKTALKLGSRLNTRFKGDNADLVTRWIRAGSPERRGPAKGSPSLALMAGRLRR
jgi:hypothetical protein